MDLVSFLVNLAAYVDDIDAGRKGSATTGERAVYEQRLANMIVAQNSYLSLQKKALGSER